MPPVSRVRIDRDPLCRRLFLKFSRQDADGQHRMVLTVSTCGCGHEVKEHIYGNVKAECRLCTCRRVHEAVASPVVKVPAAAKEPRAVVDPGVSATMKMLSKRRVASLTPERRSEIARNAALARHGKK